MRGHFCSWDNIQKSKIYIKKLLIFVFIWVYLAAYWNYTEIWKFGWKKHLKFVPLSWLSCELKLKHLRTSSSLQKKIKWENWICFYLSWFSCEWKLTNEVWQGDGGQKTSRFSRNSVRQDHKIGRYLHCVCMDRAGSCCDNM